ncbi:hypothetical protein GH5_05867 [Leishmania sp. Ghana 2012 LV757]|uniref:hypothetical protein n=1 Tax=Leishmania sp. Ghana 2012 LV757 TaxID=2803181 RepID=UPI001B6E0306|nr:hypothetical protein GH5_05867 [Leishmania sp. Ghana 2012 LV757]
MEAVIEKTQRELGAVIQAPKLTEKLLSRPPFRYIHDIVMSFMKATGFPEGLFNADQLDSSRVADKKAKIQFLEQLIAAVEAATGTPIGVRPTKIVAGEEADKTNELLQQLAKCASLSSAQKEAAVRKVRGSDELASTAPLPAHSTPASAAAPASSSKESAQANAVLQETEAERGKRREEERRRRHEEKKREVERGKERTVTEPFSRSKDDGNPDAANAASGEMDTASTATTSARKAPPRPKPTHEVIEAHNAAADATPMVSVIREGKRGKTDAESDEDGREDWQKVAEQYEVKPAARTAAVAEDADVKGLLGQQALKAKRDQEAAARRSEVGGDSAAAAIPADGGIIIRSSKNTTSRGGGSHALGDSDLSRLREQLQLLTKASNPLGKFLEAIHDDIDSMTRELEMWRSESRSQALAAAEARRQTEESLQEIHANLQNLEDAISDQVLKTNNLRRTILANDAVMESMMKTIVNPDIAAR